MNYFSTPFILLYHDFASFKFVVDRVIKRIPQKNFGVKHTSNNIKVLYVLLV